jgi:hypothetical protein
VKRERDRQGNTGREIQAGERGEGDIKKLFGDLDYFLTSARISIEVYATSRLQRRAL